MSELTTLQKCLWIEKLEKQAMPPEIRSNVYNIAEALMLDGETAPQNVEYIDKLYEKLKERKDDGHS